MFCVVYFATITESWTTLVLVHLLPAMDRAHTLRLSSMNNVIVSHEFFSNVRVCFSTGELQLYKAVRGQLCVLSRNVIDPHLDYWTKAASLVPRAQHTGYELTTSNHTQTCLYNVCIQRDTICACNIQRTICVYFHLRTY